ncbi:MAG TPA: ATP-binding protein [Rikenellaceae bacterium]|nr:ATP-binding protein [Rikenellaceae bacterium]
MDILNQTTLQQCALFITGKAIMEIEIKLENRVAELERLASILNDIGREWALTPLFVNQLNLVLEEAVTNIMFYSYSDSSLHCITINIINHNDTIEICICDDGKPYNPTKKIDPDITLDAEKREVGGLGIFIIKKIMDRVTYTYENNQNKLTLIKRK